MQVCRKMSLIYLVLLTVTASLSADQAGDFFRFLEARDRSITTYEIKLQQISFDIALDNYKAFKKNVEEMTKDKSGSKSPLQKVEQLVRKWTENTHGLERHFLHRSERFKETLVFRGGGNEFIIYDGRLYYDYSALNRQLDIYSTIPNVHHTNLADLGLSAGGPGSHGKVLSFEQSKEGVRCVISFSDDNTRITTKEYNRDFGLCHSSFKYGDEIQMEDFYLLHEKIDGYSVPRLKINISPVIRRNKCSVWILVVEDVKFNVPMRDEDLSLGQLPDAVQVIDYRFKPMIRWRYDEYCRAAVNPDAVLSGYTRPQDLLEFLDKTRGGRETLATRDSRIGQKAPRPNIKRWLSKPDGEDTWPPERFTVLNFWSTECGYCVHEVPENNELAQWLKDHGGLLLSIHAAANEPGYITRFMENHGVQYPVGMDEPGSERSYWNSATFAEYGINAVPEYVIIAEDGSVLSYERTVTKQMLEELMTKKPDQVAARTKGKVEQRLDLIPKCWIADALIPDSKIQGRFFVFRPETPDADLHELGGSDGAIDCQWIRHSSDGQTIYEVTLTARTPDWGQTLKGEVALVEQYGYVEEMVTIPYELQSRSLAEPASDIIWLGPAAKGETISKTIALQCDQKRDIKVTAVSVPPEIRLNIAESGEGLNRIPVKCAFSSQESGLRRGTVQLLVRDGDGSEQPLRLEYYAYVRR
jgi:thiol-disulfide isomerase/thioredoxin